LYFDYSTLKEHNTYTIVKPVLTALSHIVYSTRCIGKENVPKTGKLIIACNHIGTPDPGFIVANCPRKVHYMAKSELFEKKPLSKLFTLMNAFPVVRCSADRKALRFALEILKQDWVLGIFPEGRRVRNSESFSPVDGLGGVGYLARLSGADVPPCCLYREPDGRVLRPKVVVIFGHVIKNSDLGFHGENRSAETKQAAKIIMDEIKFLWDEADRKRKAQAYENRNS